MKHRSHKFILSRSSAGRKALIKNLANSLILYESLKTTAAKAKALKPKVEKLITKSKKNNLTARRELLNYLRNEKAVKKIFEVLLPRYQNRPGGYLKIVKTAQRKGDNTLINIIKFV